MLKIVTVPNSILTTSVKPVTVFDEKLFNLIYEMEETLVTQHNPEGVGLAAPQIGRNIAVFIIKPGPKENTEIFINPKILTRKNTAENSPAKKDGSGTRGGERKQPLEGCLSIPRIWGPVKRDKKIFVEYQDIKGNINKEWFADFKAVIIQHEMDHLNGILFTQRALEQQSPLYEEKEGNLERFDY